MPNTITKEYISGLVRRVDEQQRMAEFVISDNSTDRHGTVLNMDNFQLDNFQKNPIVLYQHQGYGGPDSDPDDVIGSAEVFMEGIGEDKKLIGRAYFENAETNEKADKIFKKVVQGTLRATSVGFIPIEDEAGRIGQFGVTDSQGNRMNSDTFYFNGQELLEFSVVNIPSNPNAVKNRMNRAEPGELNVGDFVRWNSSGGKAEGKIDRIQTSGTIDVPDSSFTINASEDNPAALITVYQENEDGLYEASDVQVGHRFSALTKIDPLPTPRAAPKRQHKHVPELEMTPTAPRDREWDSEAAEQRLRRFFSSDGSGDKETIDFDQYQRAFGYVMDGEEGNFAAYKLPHHDIVDGQLVVVYNALIAAAAAVNGARGGVDIPDADMEAVKMHITMHYHQFSERSPFEEESEEDSDGDEEQTNNLSYDTYRMIKIRERELELLNVNT